MAIENPPLAPDGIAQYIVDGLLRQDKESLKQIEEYAKELTVKNSPTVIVSPRTS